MSLSFNCSAKTRTILPPSFPERWENLSDTVKGPRMYQRQLQFLKKYTKAAERGESLLSRIAPDQTLDGASADDMEDDTINTGSDHENELGAWANDVVDEALLIPMDADGGMYNFL